MGEQKRKRMALNNGIGRACGNCMYWRRLEVGKPTGDCRWHPPTVILIGMLQSKIAGQPPMPVTDSFWTRMPESEWCGQWERQIDLATQLDQKALEATETEGTA
jgi:hypothetical protein